MSIQIPVSDVIRVVLQFLKQNNLHKSFELLQQESKICLNITDKDYLQNAIILGKWDIVLSQVKNLLLPEDTLILLYETIVQDMIIHGQSQGALYMINTFIKSRPSNKQYQQRILRLQYLCMPNSTKSSLKQFQESKRKNVIKLIIQQIIQAPPQRLVKLLTQALKFQVQQGIINPSAKLNMFQDKVFEYKQQQETLVRVIDKIVKYPQESKVSSIAMSHQGEYLALGFDDGLIQIYNPNQYKLDSKLQYQNNNNFLFHTSTITSLVFQQTDDMIASGDKSGQLKIWNLLSGKCLRKINTGAYPVSALTFGSDPSHILSAYETIDVYGLKSTTILRSFKGHLSYVNSIIILEQKSEMLTCSKDGSIKLWNYITQQEIKSYSPSTQSVVQPQICKLIIFDNSQHLLICTRDNNISLTQPDLRSFDYLAADNKQQQFLSWATSGHKGLFIYSCIQTIDKKWKIAAHNRQTKRIQFHSLIDSQIKLMVHHPKRNILICSCANGNLEFRRP